MANVYFLHTPSIDHDLYQGRQLVYCCDVISADNLTFHHPVEAIDGLTHHDLLKLREEIQGSTSITAEAGHLLKATAEEWCDLLSGKTLVFPAESISAAEPFDAYLGFSDDLTGSPVL